MPTRRRVFVDVETTGLDPDVHEAVEVAWATEDGPVRSLVLPHELRQPNPSALVVNGYLERNLWRSENFASRGQIQGLHTALKDATLVGANPRFDAAFLRAFFVRQGLSFDPEPWHYRLLDVQAYAMGTLGLDEMPGLADLRRLLTEKGHAIPEPDHTAARDVEATRAVWRALKLKTQGVEDVTPQPGERWVLDPACQDTYLGAFAGALSVPETVVVKSGPDKDGDYLVRDPETARTQFVEPRFLIRRAA